MMLFERWENTFDSGIEGSGGKAWNIARMSRYGIRVPPGIIVSTLLANHIQRSDNVASKIAALPALSERDCRSRELASMLAAIHSAIRTAQLPDEFIETLRVALAHDRMAAESYAIRSSGVAEDGINASFAGIHDSVLNVSGFDNIIDAILLTIASAWSVRALAYRQKWHISDASARMAVMIMPMVKSDAGGVVFTANAVTGCRNTLVIEAARGLPVAIVDASGRNDRYEFNTSAFSPRATRTVLGKQEYQMHMDAGGVAKVRVPPEQQHQPVLTVTERRNLAEQCKRIQLALCGDDEAFDIEWAKLDGQFVFLQARPVTLPDRPVAAISGPLATVWSTANLKDASPDVQSPLGADLMRTVISDILMTPFRTARYRPAQSVRLSTFIAGRPYLNTSALQWLYYDAFGLPPKELNDAIGGHQGEAFDPSSFSAPSVSVRVARFMRRTALSASGLAVFALSPFTQRRASRLAHRACQSDWSALSNPALVRVMVERQRAIKASGRQFQMMNAVAGGAYACMSRLIRARAVGNAEALAARLLAGTGGVASAMVGAALAQLALTLKDDPAFAEFNSHDASAADLASALVRQQTASGFKAGFAAFMRQYGHRAVYEMEIANPRWIEQPRFILENVILLSCEAHVVRDPLRIYQAAMREIGMAGYGWLAGGLLHVVIGSARYSMRLRENAKSNLVKTAQPLRAAFIEAGRRLAENGTIADANDIFFCSWWDVQAALASACGTTPLTRLIADRKLKTARFAASHPGDVVTSAGVGVGAKKPHSTPRHPMPRKLRLMGTAVAGGMVEGTARIIDHPDQHHLLQPGDILVARTSDPAWTPLYFRAGGVVLEMGGMLSHGSILARELGLPGVANVRDARLHITDGDLIRVDGDRGEITVFAHDPILSTGE